MSLYIFNNNQEVVKIVPYKRVISLEQEQEINSTDALSLEIPNDVWLTVEDEPSYVAVRDDYERYTFHMYKLVKVNVGTSTTVVRGIQIGFDELKAYGYIKDRRFSSYSVRRVAEAIVEDTEWELGYVSDSLPTVSTNFYYISRLESLSKLLELSGAEVQFRVEISGNKVIAKRMDLYSQLGKDTGKRFTYGDKLLTVEKETDSVGVVTALVGRGRGEETEAGGFGRKLTFVDVEWGEDKPVVKPLGQEFVEIPQMTALYGYSDGTPRYGIAEFNDTEDPEELLEQTYRALVEMSRPQVQFKASVQVVGDLGLGDTVAIIRDDVGIRYKTRVFKVRRDLLNNNRTVVELGDKVGQSVGKTLGKLVSTVNEQREELVAIVQTAANGKNKIFRGEQEPSSGMMVGDLWYKPIEDGEVEMYQWNGNIWELVITSGVNEELEQRLDQAHKDIADARGEAEKALDEVGTALEDISGLTVTVGQLSNKWIMAIEDGDDIVTAINATGDGVYVKGEKIVLDGDTTIAGSFTVTDTIFADEMNISKFTTGTLDASDVNIVNLNAENIVGNNADLIRASFSSATGGETTIESGGVKTTNPSGDYTIIERGDIRFHDRNEDMVGILRPLYTREDRTPVMTMQIPKDKGFRLFKSDAIDVTYDEYLSENDAILRIETDGEFLFRERIRTSLGLRFTTGGGARSLDARIQGTVGRSLYIGAPESIYIDTDLEITGDLDITGVVESQLRIADRNNIIWGNSTKGLQLSSNKEIGLGGSVTRLYSNLDMNANTIINQSDVRLKRNIRPSKVDAVREIERLEFIDFEWDKDKRPDSPDDEQFGIKAQYTPFLQTKASGEDSYLSVDLGKQVNLNSKAIQEVVAILKNNNLMEAV